MRAHFYSIPLLIFAVPAFAIDSNLNSARAELFPKSGSHVKGIVEFKQKADGLHVHYRIKGLAPNSMHGFHVHAKGDCSSKDGKSAGGHYVVVGQTGGTSLDTPQKYAGDMPEVQANDKGKAEGNFVLSTLSIDGTNPVVGQAVIIHALGDDATKKASPRLACGVIKATSDSLPPAAERGDQRNPDERAPEHADHAERE